MLNEQVILVVAPHADDETLGCGGTLLRYAEQGASIHWLLVTGMSESYGYSSSLVDKRKQEVSDVASDYGMEDVHELGFEPAALDVVSKGDLISAVSKVVCAIKPSVVFTPYRNDAHSDHEVVFDAVMAATKTFRYPFIKKVLAYETLSETDYGMKPEDRGFRPNVFIDIEPHLPKKLSILQHFQSELAHFPFPRSPEAVEALARVRGAQCYKKAAEAFMLIKEVV